MSVRRRQQPVRAPRAVAVATLAGTALTVAAACSGTAGSTAPATTPPSAAPTTTIAAVDGALRVEVDAERHSDLLEPPVPGDDVDDVLLVGDSVLVLVADDLARMLDATLHIDAADCRTLAASSAGGCGGVPPGVTVESGIEAAGAALAGLRDRDVVPDAAVFVLANNSTLARADVETAVADATRAGVQRIWWVNSRIDGFGRQDLNNRLLDDVAARDPRVGVVDWFSASEGRDWLVDHVHPDDRGQRALARLIAGRVRCGCVP